MNEIIDAMNYIKHDPDSVVYYVHNTIPHEFIFRHEFLTRMYMYSLFYQIYPQTTPRSISEVNIPSEVFEVMKKSADIMQQVDSVAILDKYSFRHFVDTVLYYRELNMISENDVDQLKDELHQLLDEMERYTVIGESSYGKKINVFLSHKSFDCAYTYLKGNGMEACSVRVYGIDYISCENPKVCEAQKRWIDSLMRFSTLISVSGEIHRNEYFKAQRDTVNSL